MDTTTLSNRNCSTRSSSVSSIGSCISVGSDDTEDGDDDEPGGSSSGGGFESGDSGLDSPGGSSSAGVGVDVEVAEKQKTAGEWIGTPRLCDFGMSVRIPTSPVTGVCVCVCARARAERHSVRFVVQMACFCIFILVHGQLKTRLPPIRVHTRIMPAIAVLLVCC